MSHYRYHRDYEYEYEDEDRVYRYQARSCNRPRAKIMGVCAGLARQFGWDVTLVRVAALLSLFVFTIPTFFLYIIAGAVFY